MRHCSFTRLNSENLSSGCSYLGGLLRFGVIVGSFIGPTLAQEVLRIVDGRLGSMLAAPHHIDDLDGDGVTDVLVHGTNSFGLGQGTYFVLSGVTLPGQIGHPNRRDRRQDVRHGTEETTDVLG